MSESPDSLIPQDTPAQRAPRLGLIAVVGVAFMLAAAATAFLLLRHGLAADEPIYAEFNEAAAERAKPAAASTVPFGISLFKAVADKRPDENVILSPLSATLALAMAREGARGKTRDEMTAVLGLGGISDEAAPAAFTALASSAGERNGVVLNLANSMWVQKGFAVKPEYAEIVRRRYAAVARNGDFNDAGFVEDINDWVSDHTAGKIEGLVDPQSAKGTMLALVNALYFNGKWETPFKENATRAEVFWPETGQRYDVQMMHQTARMRVAVTEDAIAVELPYEGGDFVMVAVLPAKGSKLADLRGKLTAEVWNGWASALREARRDDTELSLPRFELRDGGEFRDALETLGMKAAFSGADFSGVAEGELFVRTVAQKVYVRADEKGTEAAAATHSEIAKSEKPAVPDRPRIVRFDRPFLFAITDKATGALLFLGQVARPSEAK